MSVPKGSAWQIVRGRALDAVPIGIRVSFQSPSTFRSWQASGSYKVDLVTSRRATLAAFTDEVGAAFLGEAEQFLDHAAEHNASLLYQLRGTTWTSAAWQMVTIYYWAYFALLALTRLTGDSLWFVDDTIAKQLTNMGPAGSAALNAGVFRIACGSILSATEREINLKKMTGRAHDALWTSWSEFVSHVLIAARPSSGSEEERLFTAIKRANSALGNSWPSDLRNAINYRPGFAYRAVRESQLASPTRRVRTDRPYEFGELLNDFETHVSGLDQRLDLVSQAEVASKVMIHYTFLLQRFALAAYEEVLDRAGFDKRWQQRRATFLVRHGVTTADGTWPLT